MCYTIQNVFNNHAQTTDVFVNVILPHNSQAQELGETCFLNMLISLDGKLLGKVRNYSYSLAAMYYKVGVHVSEV